MLSKEITATDRVVANYSQRVAGYSQRVAGYSQRSRSDTYNRMLASIKNGETVDIAEVLDACDEPVVFVTGKAGAGKTVGLKRYCQLTKKKIVVCAPTGVAALNCNGSTIHRLFGLPIGYLNKQEIEQVAQRQKKAVKAADVLILEESSMISSPMLDCIDTILRIARRNLSQSFGGMQVIMFGDVYQLPAITKQEDWDAAKLGEKYESPFFFSSEVLRKHPPLVLNMEKIFRQSEKEMEFIEILNAVRDGKIDDTLLERLNSRVRPDFKEVAGYVSIVSTNREVDTINRRHLNSIPGQERIYGPTSQGEFNARNAPCDDPLSLRVGAQVMFTANDPTSKDSTPRYVNGTVGQVESMDDESIKVRLENGSVVAASQFTWENIKYDVDEDGQIKKEITGSYTQFPLRVAAALTVHKMQGLTTDKAIIDAGGIFECGQLYVALSRCRSLGGMVLRRPVARSAIRTNQHVLKWFKDLTESGQLLGVQQLFLQQSDLTPKEQKTQTQQANEYTDIMSRLKNGEFLPDEKLELIRDMMNDDAFDVMSADTPCKSDIILTGFELFIDEIMRLRLENKDLATMIKRQATRLEKLPASKVFSLSERGR